MSFIMRCGRCNKVGHSFWAGREGKWEGWCCAKEWLFKLKAKDNG